MSPIVLMLVLQASAITADDLCYSKALTQLTLNECAAVSLEAADSKLAEFVRTYEARLEPEQLALFRSSQLNWQQFRQAACKFEASGVSGGSAYPMVFAQCLASKSGSRLSELMLLAKCRDGDYACPGHSGVAPNNSFKPNPLRGSA
ncbi:MAG: DUF1311 domain-containing protein [Alphaproteobacteria bacterium]|nr:MAG: DUF1311 domain-containing protein [Alphaproteobacteria bacterium]